MRRLGFSDPGALQRSAYALLQTFRDATQIVARSPSPGYEAWLIERGEFPLVARLRAHLVVRSGARVANEGQRRPEVLRALRFLSKTGRNAAAVRRRVDVLLRACEETSIIETLFEDAGLNWAEFISSLTAAAGGDSSAFHRLAAIAASLGPYLPNGRGRRVTAASAAHEFFLEEMVLPAAAVAYAWSDYNGDFTDAATQATRRQFDVADFDPRPAHRRLKARQSRKSAAGPGSP